MFLENNSVQYIYFGTANKLSGPFGSGKEEKLKQNFFYFDVRWQVVKHKDKVSELEGKVSGNYSVCCAHKD